MALAEQLKNNPGARRKKRTEPLWKGPEEDGITFSLLSRFLVCRERFRLLVVEGLRPFDAFSHRLEFGQMWHVCEEALAGEAEHLKTHPDNEGHIAFRLRQYCQSLCKRYPLQQDEINKWYHVCKVQFPLYVKHWSQHPDVKERTPLLQEQVFNVPYKLPSGRAVRLRGKWDSVDLIGKGKSAGIYLQENKTKSRIDERQLKRQLTWDLQTMLYLVSLSAAGIYILTNHKTSAPILGIRYNVIRRTEHRVGKKETTADFAERLKGVIEEDPSHWFMRWKVEVSAADVVRFRRECLDPILEQLCDWWEWVNTCGDNLFGPMHFRFPYGTYSTIIEGITGDLDECLANGSEVGLTRAESLFPELE